MTGPGSEKDIGQPVFENVFEFIAFLIRVNGNAGPHESLGRKRP
jgi:hypothetical protein